MELSITVFDDANKLLLHQSSPQSSAVASTVLNPYETVRSLFAQNGVRVDAVEATLPCGRKAAYKYYPQNKLCILLLIRRGGDEDTKLAACKGLLHVVYGVLMLNGGWTRGQMTDFCAADAEAAAHISETMRRSRGVICPLLERFRLLYCPEAPLALATLASRVDAVNKPLLQRLRFCLDRHVVSDDVLASCITDGATVVAMSEAYRARSGLDRRLLHMVLPLLLASLPPATLRDFPFDISKGKLRIASLLLFDQVHLVLLCQVSATGMMLFSSQHPLVSHAPTSWVHVPLRLHLHWLRGCKNPTKTRRCVSELEPSPLPHNTHAGHTGVGELARNILANDEVIGAVGSLRGYLRGDVSAAKGDAALHAPCVALPQEIREVCVFHLPNEKSMALMRDAGVEEWSVIGGQPALGGGSSYHTPPYTIIKNAAHRGVAIQEDSGRRADASLYSALVETVAGTLTLATPCFAGGHIPVVRSGRFVTSAGVLCTWTVDPDSAHPNLRVTASLFHRSGATLQRHVAEGLHGVALSLLHKARKHLTEVLDA